MTRQEISTLPGEVLLTPAEVSLLLGIRPQTLAVWRCTGRVSLPFVKLGTRAVRYEKQAVMAFLHGQGAGAPAQVAR
jgi:predicted site-specific integrase-resolvase